MTTARPAMPYRRAYWAIGALTIVAILGFWRNYFAVLDEVVWSWHFHAVPASLWTLLTGLQSWSIATKRVPLHRAFGKASLLLFPVFFASMLTIVHTMAAATAPAHPFYRFWGGPLGVQDGLATIAIGVLFYQALRHRRQVQQHARYMLAIPLFLLPPAIERLFSHYVPWLRMNGPQDFAFFRWDMLLANSISIAITLALYRQAPRYGRAFAITAAFMVLQIFGFETVGQTTAWTAAFMAFGTLLAPIVVLTGFAVGILLTWMGWVSPVAPKKPKRDETTDAFPKAMSATSR